MYLYAEEKCRAHREKLLEISAFINVVESNPDAFLALLPTSNVIQYTGLDPVGYNRGYAEGYIIGQFVQIPAIFKIGKISGIQALKIFRSPIASALITRSKALIKDNITILQSAKVIRSIGANKISALLDKFGWPKLQYALDNVDDFEGIDEVADVLEEYDRLRDAGKTFMDMEPFRKRVIQSAEAGELKPELITEGGARSRWKGWIDGLSMENIRSILATAEGGAYTAITVTDVSRIYSNRGKSALGYLVGAAQRKISRGLSEFDHIVLSKMSRGEVDTVELHHFLTNKFNGDPNYSKQFLQRLSEAFPNKTWNLDEPWNKEFVVNHQGRHTEAYSERMLDEVKKIITETKPDVDAFFRKFEILKLKIAKDPVAYGVINQ